jgi:hypothetical protein
MASRRRVLALALACWVAPAAALDRAGAIEAAKREMKGTCTAESPCKFSAEPQEGKWHVRVEFSKGNSPQAILIFNQAGKVVGRIQGKK